MESMLKIAILTQSAENGGVQHVVRNLARGLDGLGYSVAILACDATGDAFKGIPPSVSIVDFGKSKCHGDYKVIASLGAVRRYVQNDSTEFLIASPGIAGQISVLSTWGLPCRTIVMIDNKVTLMRAKSLKHRIAYEIGKLLYRKADALVLAHDAALRDFRENIGASAAIVQRIYHPLIPENVSQLAGERIFGSWPSGDEVVVAAGRLVVEKDFETLIRAFALVRHQRNAKLIILGDGPLREKLEELSSSLGIAEDVAFAGHVENPYKYFARAQVFVLSSRQEAFGNVLIEAMACGTPVVATCCESGGPQEILSDGKFGIMCSCENAEELASAIVRSLNGENPVSCETLRSRASVFGEDYSVRQYSGLIEGLRVTNGCESKAAS